MLTIQKLHIVSKLVLYKDSVHYFKMNAKATSLWVSDHRILLSILPLKSFFGGSAVILWKRATADFVRDSDGRLFFAWSWIIIFFTHIMTNFYHPPRAHPGLKSTYFLFNKVLFLEGLCKLYEKHLSLAERALNPLHNWLENGKSK